MIKLIISSLAVFLASYMLPGIKVESYFAAIILALVLSFLNYFVKPILILLTIPVTIITFGLFLLAINAFIILFADFIVDGFRVDSFWWALLFSVTLAILTSILEKIAKFGEKKDTYSQLGE